MSVYGADTIEEIEEEINNSVVPHLSAVLISCNHSITRIISFTKNGSKQGSIVSVYGPCIHALPEGLVAEDCRTLVSGHVMLLLEHVRRLLYVLTT